MIIQNEGQTKQQQLRMSYNSANVQNQNKSTQKKYTPQSKNQMQND